MASAPLAFNKMKFDVQVYLHTSTIKPESHDSRIIHKKDHV